MTLGNDPRTVGDKVSMANDGSTRRHRFSTIIFGLVVAAAVLAVFPATAPAGITLCFFLVLPAMVAVWRTRKASVGTRRRSVAALVVAPVFLVVGAGVMPHTPVTAAVVQAAPAAAAPIAVTPTAIAPATVTPTTAAPVPSPVAAEPAPVVAQGAVPAPAVAQAAVAPAAAPRVAAPQAVVAKPAAPKPVAAKPAAPKPAAGSSCGTNSYINSAGNCVPRPVAAPSAPAGATAQCKDGTYSSSQTRSGTCSRHGGVSRWL